MNDSSSPTLPASRTIAEDHACGSCGYNVRGLTWGRKCPECGVEIRRREALRVRPDVLGGAQPGERARVSLALGAMWVVIAAAVIVRWTALGAGFAAPVGASYHVFCAANGLVWAVAVMVVLNSPVGERMFKAVLLRWWMIGSQGLWTAAFLMLIAGRGQAWATVVFFLLRMVAGIAWIALTWKLHRVAEDADLDDATQRLLNATWLVPLAAVPAALFPQQIPWIAIVPLAFLLIGWSWAMGLCALGLREMQQHAGWANRHMHEQVGREERVAAKRAALERQAMARKRRSEEEEQE